MTIDEAISYGKSRIHSDHAKLLLSDLLNINPLELLLHLDDPMDEEKFEIYKKEVNAIKDNKPIQYVLGSANFYGKKFYINENVLIPRFETEELVENTIAKALKLFNKPVDIIDIGTGSGVIGLTLERNLDINSIDLVDISKEALEVTKINVNNMNSKASIIESDVFENINKKYDIIISNPPYIKTDEEIEEIVKNNEPHIALYAGIDGLDIYKKILSTITPHMKEKCLIAFEIGSDQSDDLKKIIEEYLGNVDIEVKKDLQDRERMLFITIDK